MPDPGPAVNPRFLRAHRESIRAKALTAQHATRYDACMTTTEPASKTTVTLWKDGGWTRWTAHFATADQAIAYVERRNAGVDVLDHARVNLEEVVFDSQVNWPEDIVATTFPATGPLTPDQLRLMSYLYPQCEHGMSADLCMGPGHFMSREQEMAMGW